MQTTSSQTVHPIVVLGAGINGAALARELVLNHVPVWLIDRADIASGTTAYSSRLIHGGLRYLEYGEFDLVKESLGERTRLLKLAPHYVRPLQLFIPVSNQWGGLLTSATRFLGLDRGAAAGGERGLWWVRLGLSMYDMYAHDPTLPKHLTEQTGTSGNRQQPRINSRTYPWVCSYYDAQVSYPERFTLALVEDAMRIAHERGLEFRVLTYHQCRLQGKMLSVYRSDPEHPYTSQSPGPAELTVEPELIVNATGAWVDQTLQSLSVAEKELLQGTKGTHLFTMSSRLREALRGSAIYGEASDGRPAFIIPLGSGTLVGTTDDRFTGPPESAIATEHELHYLINLVNTLVEGVNLTRDDVTWHYAGVRPLPKVNGGTTGAITRRHFLVENEHSPVPMYSIVGGKLTTCRSLAEHATKLLLDRLGQSVVANSESRPLPGGENYPGTESELHGYQSQVASKTGFELKQVVAVWRLKGTRTAAILEGVNNGGGESVPGTHLPVSFVRWVIQHEHVRTLNDLVERRLMLLFDTPPSLETLQLMAELLVQEGVLKSDSVEVEVERTRMRLRKHFGYSVH